MKPEQGAVAAPAPILPRSGGSGASAARGRQVGWSRFFGGGGVLGDRRRARPVRQRFDRVWQAAEGMSGVPWRGYSPLRRPGGVQRKGKRIPRPCHVDTGPAHLR